MKKYFMELVKNMPKKSIPPEKIERYRDMLISELEKQGASESDLELISEEMIINAINNNRKVDDIAWAILQ